VRILRPVQTPVGESSAPRYEIFHDVLAAAILDWRVRSVRAQEQGLEGLRGRAFAISHVLAAGTIALTVPLALTLATYDSTLGALPIGQLALITTVGFVVVFFGVMKLARACLQGGRAAERGFGWLTVAEVLADRRVDLAALVAGTREYAALDAAGRARCALCDCSRRARSWWPWWRRCSLYWCSCGSVPWAFCRPSRWRR
jgi:hypothetical protein